MGVARTGHGSRTRAVRIALLSVASLLSALSAYPSFAAPDRVSGTSAVPLAQSAAGVTFRIFASREGLVGSTTSSGHRIIPNDHFVALPSKSALNKSVRIAYKGKSVTAPVLDIGPFNVDDDYWNPTDVRTYKLPRGVPQAQAAFQNGHNNGKSGIDIKVNAPLGLDIGDGTFADLGMTNTDWVDVTFLWLTDSGADTPPPASKAAPETVKTAPAPPAPVVRKNGDIDVSAMTPLSGDDAPPLDDAAPLGDGYLFVAETNHNVPTVIAKYWKDKGGVPVFGYPLSELFLRSSGGEQHVYQYFERAVMEYLPATGSVTLAPIGAWFAEVKGPYDKVPAFDSTAKKRYVAKTGHSVGGSILQWYAANGDADFFGNPLNEETAFTTADGRKVTAQLFERVRIEVDSKGNVTLGRLGAEWLIQRGWS